MNEDKQPNCKYCWDKGYYTYFSGYTISPDFIGDERYTSEMRVKEIPCKKCGVSKEDNCPNYLEITDEELEKESILFIPDEVLNQTEEQPTQSWEERYDRMTDSDFYSSETIEDDGRIVKEDETLFCWDNFQNELASYPESELELDVDKVKRFISQELQARDEEWRAKVEGLKNTLIRKKPNYQLAGNWETDEGYNEAIDEIKIKINQLLNQ